MDAGRKQELTERIESARYGAGLSVLAVRLDDTLRSPQIELVKALADAVCELAGYIEELLLKEV